jgi:ParB/RepB/Spo0J family partition protein
MNTTQVEISRIIREDSPRPSKGFVESLKEEGVIEPVVLQETANGQYLILDGRRRIEGSELAGLGEVPAVVYGVDEIDTNNFDLILLKLQFLRSPNPGRELAAVKRRIREGRTIEEIAESIGVNVVRVRRLFRLSNLCATGLKLLCSGHISETKALSLARLPTDVQESLLAEHGQKIKAEAVQAAIREQSLVVVQADLGGFDDLPKLSPIQAKFEELASVLLVSSEAGERVREAITVLREFVHECFGEKGRSADDNRNEDGSEAGMREQGAGRPVCVRGHVAPRVAA